jgi:hypothetical protein
MKCTKFLFFTKLVQGCNVGIQIVKIVRIRRVVFRGPFRRLGDMLVDATLSLGFVVHRIKPNHSLEEMMQLGI